MLESCSAPCRALEAVLRMKVVVVADTHLRAGFAGRIDARLLRAMEEADVVLHAGDVTSREALSAFEAVAPTIAVLGNNDQELCGALPERRELILGGVRVAMIHDSGERRRRSARLAAYFPRAQLVVYGHSHVPDDSTGIDGQVLFNPGSPTQRRSQPRASFGHLELDDGQILSHRIELL